MAATTKAQRMKAIKDNAEKERAKAAAETLAFEKRTAEINKQIAKKNRERKLRANANVTAVPAFEPTSVNLTEVPPLTSSVTPMSAAEEAVIDNDIELARIQQATNGIDINPEFVQRAMRDANANGDTRVTPQTLAGTPSIIDRMSQWGDDVWDSFFDDEIGDASVAQAKQDINPIAEGDIGNQEYKGPVDEGLGTVSIYGPLKGAKVAGSFIKSAFTAGKNAYKNRPKPQPIVEKHVNPTPLLPAPKPVLVPRIGNNMPSTVVKQSINTGKNVVPRNMNRWGEPMQRYTPKPKIGPGVPTIAAVTNQQEPPKEYPMGPTIDITYKPDDAVTVVPPVDMPQNGGPDRGGYPNKTRLPNNANAAPQRPGYNVVKSGDGSPVKSGNGYAWTKDYQHPIWAQDGIWKQGGNN